MGRITEPFMKLGFAGVAAVATEHVLANLGVKRPIGLQRDFAPSTLPMIHHPDGSPVDNFLKAHPARSEVKGPVAPH